MKKTIYDFTPQELRRIAFIKDAIDELVRELRELAGELKPSCPQVVDASAKVRKSFTRKPRVLSRITIPIAPELSKTTSKLPVPTPEPIPDQSPKSTECLPLAPTTHVTEGSQSMSNNKLTDEQHQAAVVTEAMPLVPFTDAIGISQSPSNYQQTEEQHQMPSVRVTEGEQQSTTVIAKSAETGSSPENPASPLARAIEARWEAPRLLQEVSRIIIAYPEKIPALKTLGIPVLTNDYIGKAIEAVRSLPFSAETLSGSLWQLGKNVTQDDSVLPAIMQLGLRNMGDLLGKLTELRRFANKRGQILLLARIWSLAGVGGAPSNTGE
jgi:hypothetical protein